MEKPHQITQSPLSSPSTENLADIASRVIHELNLTHTSFDDNDDVIFSNDAFQEGIEDDGDGDDSSSSSEFEFAVFSGGGDTSSPTSADELFSNGQIKPTTSFPLFDTSLLSQTDFHKTAIRLPLRRLMTQDKETGNGNGNANSSCSSSEADELEGVPQGTYCVWAPQQKQKQNDDDEAVMRKKSNSTGSNATSRRFRIRDLLLNRSNSDGKDTFVFLTPLSSHHHNNQQGGVKGKQGKGKGKEEMKKKKSYLPYRQDLVGFFSNVNGISRTVNPF